jgi:hypothetical protein
MRSLGILFVAIFSACGQQEIAFVTGPKGEQGVQGERGAQGDQGEGCTVATAVNGALVTCGANSVLILNGEDGSDAPPTPLTITKIIDPCGKQGSGFNEVLLKLANDNIMAHFSSGANQFFALLTPGNYVTTDGTNCNFNVSNTYQVTWSGGGE